ncbi:MAG: hypothetical protein AB1782_00405 [Cyanobacteriota bacterium]
MNTGNAGIYDPDNADVQKISKCLKGDCFIMHTGNDYYLLEKLDGDLFKLISDGQDLTRENLIKISKINQQASNFSSILARRTDFETIDESTNKTKLFLKTLKDKIKETDNIFEKLGLNNEEINIFNKIVSKTAFVMFLMGYPEVVEHSLQVSQLAAKIAKTDGASNEEILKSAITGWLHDPKLDTKVSWNNLAVHPVVAGVVADTALNDQEIDDLLLSYLKNKKSSNNFKYGIIESLYVNNDSLFVLNNVILSQPAIITPVKEQAIDLSQKIPDIIKITTGRFQALSRCKKVQRIPRNIEMKLNEIQIDSGYRFISNMSWNKISTTLIKKHNLKNLDSNKLLNELLEDKIHNEELLKDLIILIETDKDSVKNLKINAINIFCHQDEVSDNGKIASLSLIVADSLLLSPQKILTTGYQNTPQKRLNSFIDSFKDNIEYIPAQKRQMALEWQRDLYLSMIKAANELSGNNRLEYYNNELQNKSINQQLSILEVILKEPSTWGKYSSINIDDNNRDKFDIMIKTISNYYDKALINLINNCDFSK